MEVTAHIDEDEVLENLGLSDLVKYIKKHHTLKDVLAIWMKVNRHQLTEEKVIEFIKEEL